jgi:PIN domain nuclease of toxin-antitoxin system
LLDTHAWLWGHLEPARLGKRAAAVLADASSELWLSPVSAWEVLILAEKGRIELDGGGPAWVERALRAGPIREAPVTMGVAQASRAVKLPHQDPADRFILATAKVYDLVLVTADRRLRAQRGVQVLRADR